MIDVICWKWESPPGYRSKFTGENVNILWDMVAKNLNLPHRFSCITDNPEGIDPDIRIIPLWDTFADLPSPTRRGPSCYRRLLAFSDKAKDIIGERIFSLDLDCVITDDITPLVDRPEDFVCWGATARNTHYNGGMWLLRAGTRTEVFDTFDPVRSPEITKNKHIVGSDQGWISYVLNGKDPKWTTADGVYSFRNDFVFARNVELPENARIVMFHGRYDPWEARVQNQYPWVKGHYNLCVHGEDDKEPILPPYPAKGRQSAPQNIPSPEKQSKGRRRVNRLVNRA